MPQPTSRDVHVDAILTNLSVRYLQRANLLGNRVFPGVMVSKQSDKYYIYTKDDWFRDEAQKRAGATESVGSGYTLSTDTYYADVWALHKDVDDQLRQNADANFDLDRDANEFVMQRLMMRLERNWASTFFGTTIWSTDVTPTALWDDYAASDPIGDIETGKTYILQRTGYRPNTLVLGYNVFAALKNHPDIIDRIKYTSSEVVTEQLLARLFGVDRLFVAEAIYNTADEGQTASYSFVQGKHALLCYVPPAAGIATPSAGYTFYWNGMSGSIGQPVLTRRFRMEKLRADRIEGEIAFDHKVIGSDLGYFLASVVS